MNEELEMLKGNIESRIRELVSSLDSPNSNIGDWKVVKCYEAKLQNKEMPYDLEELMKLRQNARDEINSLQEQLKEIEVAYNEG